MTFNKSDIKRFNKIKLRRINVLDETFLWKRGHLHLEEFKFSKCVEKVNIYKDGYKNAPLVLFFKEEDNHLLNLPKENEKWNVGYPDSGIIWKSNSETTSFDEEDGNIAQINLNHSSTIEAIIKLHYSTLWIPGESSKTSWIVEDALLLLNSIEN